MCVAKYDNVNIKLTLKLKRTEKINALLKKSFFLHCVKTKIFDVLSLIANQDFAI